ncbi:MAG TPA: CoA-binding protein [Bacteroidales bacterium]
MTTLKQINEFLDSQPIALVGVSRNPKKFGYAVFKELKEKGMKLIPVNPKAEEIMGEKTYPNVKMLPPEVQSIIVFTKKDKTASVIRDAKEKGIKQIWIQQMADSKEALDELKDSGIKFITGECILMYYKPNSFHKFHGGFKKFFGRFPK